MVFRFVPSIHTCSPSSYGLNLLFPGCFIAIIFCALIKFSKASFLISSSCFSLAVTPGTGLGVDCQSSLGVNPMIISNGDFFVVALGIWLCANSAIDNHLCQSFCFLSQ